MSKVKIHAVSIKKGDIVASNARPPEDEFASFYVSGINQGPIQPAYDPLALSQIVEENNTLLQCIGAMELNIDGTGHMIIPNQNLSAEEEKRYQKIKGFFDEPFPRQSFITIRRKLRRDIETVGFGFLEVIRNATNEIAFLRHIPAHTMRLVTLDEPIETEISLYRNGEIERFNTRVRERRFAQVINNDLVYFKEYGARRALNKYTGAWGEDINQDNAATEIIYFTAITSPQTPYGIPRWINQLPSALGSREAEELNLEFFQTGGIPPFLLLVSGGQLDDDSRQHFENLLTGKAKSKLRGAVVEVQTTAGELSSAVMSKVQVERFGAEKQKDSMFEHYDERCEKRIRSSFRLPPLFVGRPDDYSYASVYASYTLAEAQVFKPERDEFDEIINVTIMRELDPTGTFKFKSLPLSVHDSTVQLEGLKLAAPLLDDEGLIDAINQVTNLNLQVEEASSILKSEPRGLKDRIQSIQALSDDDKKQAVQSLASDILSIEYDESGMIELCECALELYHA